MPHGLEIPSVFLLAQAGRDLFRYGRHIYITGTLSDRVLNVLREVGEGTEEVQDFTRIFASPRAFYAYEKAGGRVSCATSSWLSRLILWLPAGTGSTPGYSMRRWLLPSAGRCTMCEPYVLRRANGAT